MKTVNERGLQEIRQFLAENHKKGGDHFTPSMIEAWAADAEFQLSEGNPPTIELKSWDSVHGRTQEYTISDDGLDSVKIDCQEYLEPLDLEQMIDDLGTNDAGALAVVLLRQAKKQEYTITNPESMKAAIENILDNN